MQNLIMQKLITSILLIVSVFFFYNHAYSKITNPNAIGLYKLIPSTNQEKEFKYVYLNNDLSVFISSSKATYVIKSELENRTVKGQRIDVVHENTAAPELSSTPAADINAKINISVNGELYNLEKVDTVTFRNLYNQVDLKYFLSQQGGLTYFYYINQGANISDISVKYEGADQISLSEENNLIIESEVGEISASAIKTLLNNEEVMSTYSISNKNIISYNIESYSSKNKYIIDPVISYSRYIGGSGSDIFEDFAVDSSSNIYAVGTSLSNNFPTTPGAFSTTRDADEDVVILKLDPSGQILWSTFYGGNLQDEGKSIAVSDSGAVFVTGFSNSFSLPSSDNAQPGNESAFLLIFENNGTFRKARYIGGNSRDEGLALTTVGDTVFVTGYTASVNFPVAGIGATTFSNGGDDIFLTALNDTAGIIWSQYFGGSTGDRGRSITIDNQNNIIIAGETESTNLPILLGNQSTKGAFDDGFIAKFTLSGIRNYSSYYGGDGNDIIRSIETDNNGNFYITGETRSTNLNFPATGNTFQNTLSGSADVFLSKFNNGGVPQWGTYYGDTSLERGLGLGVNSAGSIIITGQTESANFPIDSINAMQTTISGGFDAFIVQFDSLGNRTYATFLGGTANDDGKAVVFEINQSGYFIGGNTRSTNFPVTSTTPLTSNSGDNDFFIYTSCSLSPNNLIEVEGVDSLSICSNEIFKTIDGATPTGGSGNYTFEYQISTDNTVFTTLAGANSEDLILDTAIFEYGFNTFRRIVTDGFCTDTSNTLTILFLEAPVSNFSFDTLCVGDLVQFTDEITVADSTTTIIGWNWTFGDGQSSTDQNPTNTYSTAGTYTVNLRVDAANSCSDSIAKSITVTPPPTADFSFTTECNNDTVSFTNTSTNVTIEEYRWDFGDGRTSTLKNPEIAFTQPNAYDVTLIVGGISGCNDTITKTLTKDSSIVVDFSTTNNRCQDSIVTFSDQSQVLSGINSWSWDLGNGTTSMAQNPTTTYNSAGSYTVKLVVTSNSGCIDFLSRTIIISTPPTADFTSEANCTEQPTQFTDVSTPANSISEWFYDFGDGSTSSLQNPTNSYANSGIYTVELMVTNQEGCSASKQTNLTITNRPTVEAGVDVTILEGQDVQLNATSNEPNIVSYNWSPANSLNLAGIANPTASPVETTLYTVIVENDENCIGTDSVLVNVDPKFFIPSVFTPNGDGDNDNFVIEGIDRFPNHQVDIFNRWGSAIFNSDGNYHTNPWNGNYNGKQMPLGTYYYIVKLDENSQLLKGTITILR